jgi:hypothetical protein
MSYTTTPQIVGPHIDDYFFCNQFSCIIIGAAGGVLIISVIVALRKIGTMPPPQPKKQATIQTGSEKTPLDKSRRADDPVQKESESAHLVGTEASPSMENPIPWWLADEAIHLVHDVTIDQTCQQPCPSDQDSIVDDSVTVCIVEV